MLKGLSEDDAKRKALFPATINLISTSALELAPILKFLKGGKGKSFLKNLYGGAMIEGSTEGLQQLSQNLVAKLGYDEARNLTDGLIDSVIGGAGSGGIVGGVSSFYGGETTSPDITPTTETEIAKQINILQTKNKLPVQTKTEPIQTITGNQRLMRHENHRHQ